MVDDIDVRLDDEPVVIDLGDRPWIETLKDNSLMGASTPQLLNILYTSHREVDFVTFAPRLFLLFLTSLFSLLFSLFDTVLFSRAVAATQIPENPVFIIGPPRSGTTLVHNLLSLDDRFVTPNTFQVGWPSSFLTMQRFAHIWPLSAAISPTRPMDALPLSWMTPQEDEIATNVLSGGVSPYMAIHLMRAHRTFLRYITFEGRDAAAALSRWRAAFLFFCRKIAYGARPGQCLLLKSPCHTGRVALLNSLFAGSARFVFVHRDPHAVFQSSHAALVRRYIRPCASLQTFTAADVQRYILAQGVILHRAFVRDSAKLPPGRIAIVAFSDLVRDTVGTMVNAVYAPLGMTVSDELRAKFAKHAEQISDFQRNSFPSITELQRRLVRRHWADMFRDFGYSDEQRQHDENRHEGLRPVIQT